MRLSDTETALRCVTTPTAASEVLVTLRPEGDARYIGKAVVESQGQRLKVSMSIRRRGETVTVTDGRFRYAAAKGWHVCLELHEQTLLLVVGQLDETPERLYSVERSLLTFAPIGVTR